MEQEKKPTGRQNEVYDWLESSIYETRLRPGDLIDEQELCERFGVSRTPVRDALLQLASRDLVVFLPRKGAMVAKLTVEELIPMWEVLSGLEVMSVELATRRMTVEERADLQRIHALGKAYVDSGDAEKFSEANRAFHGAIHTGSKNPYLTKQIRDLRVRLRSYGRRPYQRPGGLATSFAGHAEILDAMLRGDDVAAGLAMQEHVAGGLSLMDFLADAASQSTK